jgi:ATP-dependent DNA helicase RecG
MLNKTAPVNRIAGIGPQIEKLLAKLNIITLEDLTNHYPTRHIDYAHPTKIAFLKTGVPGNFTATIENITHFTTKSGKPATQATAIDDTGKISLTWFYSRFISRVIREGEQYHIAGTATRWGRDLNIISPQIESIDKEALNTKGLVPVYPLTAGITAGRLRRFIKQDLNFLEINDNLTNDQLKKLNLPNQKEALNNIHFPKTITDKKQADKRLSFNKHLEIATQNLKEMLKLGDSPNLKLDPKLHQQIIKKLPFTLTDDQQKVIKDIYKDLSKKSPTHRLIQGDTGSGKTVITIFAAALTLQNEYSFMLMAPTQILANQHYQTFKKILKTKKIHLVTSNSKLQKIPKNPAIFIGTHSLINQIPKNLKYPIATVFIDEQHKFGVKQREALQTRSPHPHVFNLTATPIPRTIALGLFGEIDISTIKNNPQKDKNIKTFVVEKNHLEKKGFTWLEERLDRNDKIFVVAPLISKGKTSLSSAEEIYKKYHQVFGKKFPIYLLHGKIDEDKKQSIIENFKKDKSAILVATPVIEVGIDIKDATTIIIHSAERFGLASLHQLRGRVARIGGEGFCFLVPSISSQEESERLTLLTKYKSGLQLAKMDLKLRGAGKIFGEVQHGRFPVRLKFFYNRSLYNQAKSLAKYMLK